MKASQPSSTCRRGACTAAFAAAFAALPAAAAIVVDTGTPNGSAVGAYTIDATDAVAGQFSFAQAADIRSLSVHLLGAGAGETFTLTLYADSAAHLPGAALQSARATLTADGWNGLANLSGWTVGAGSYWIAAGLDAIDTGGSSAVTGLLADRGAPLPLARTAFNAGNGWAASGTPMSFGLRVDAVSAVPEPAQWATLLAGCAALTLLLRKRR